MRYDIEGSPEGPQRQRHGSPTFYQLLEEMAETHDTKSHDYSNANAPFANYEFAGTLASMFSHNPIDAGFMGRLGEKIYRLYVLESGNKIPKNESVADTERDIAVIATLWMAARKESKKGREDPHIKNAYADVYKEEAADQEQSQPAAKPIQITPAFHQAMALINIMNNTEKREIYHLLKNTNSIFTI